MVTNITKRDGRRRKFSISKITSAIEAAFKSSEETYTESDIDSLVFLQRPSDAIIFENSAAAFFVFAYLLLFIC